MPGKLTTLTTAVNARITAGLLALNNANPALFPQTAGITVLVEDTNDLQTKINKAIAEIGMLVLIGEPHFVNESPFNPDTNAKITFAVAVGETPIIWRDAASLKPHCKDVSEFVAALLQYYQIAGFQKLRVLRNDFVPDKKRNLRELTIETMVTIPPLP